jgi:hypothetical protein
MTDRSVRADRLAHDRRPNPQPDDDLRSRIVEALNTCPAQFIQDDPDEGDWFKDRPYRRHDQHRYDGGCAMCRGETVALTEAVLAVVQPELDRRDAAEAKARADIAAAERGRYRAAWQSARKRAGIAKSAWRYQQWRLDSIEGEMQKDFEFQQFLWGELTERRKERDRYRAAWKSARQRAEAHSEGSQRHIEARDDWKGWMHEQAARAEKAEAALARVTALAADMRTWCSPHGLAGHYANQLDQALAGPEPTNEEA